MVAYSFKQRFVEPILSGAKRQTIRADRKRHVRPGEIMQLYVGMRTKQCRRIACAVCESVTPLRIQVGQQGHYDGLIQVADMPSLTEFPGGGIDHFARLDGFSDWAEMRQFWLDNHPGLRVFSGVLIRWSAD